MTSTSSLPFPHPTLTPIIGKPDAATLKLLRKEVYANTKSVPSTAGGGLNGHLGIAMPAGAYTIRAGQPFVKPAHPGPLPVYAAGDTNALITATNRTYNTTLSDFNTFIKVPQEVKQQILTAVDKIFLQDLEDDVFGFADVSIIDMFAHLTTTYGTLEASDLETNRNKLATQWNPDSAFENFWLRIRNIRAVANAGAAPIPDGATIELSLTSLRQAGVYDHAITAWEDKPIAEQTWANFQTHFTHHEKTRLKRLTAQAAGFHGANKITPVTPDSDASETPTPALAAAIKQADTKYNYTCQEINLYYCWTHGLSKNKAHTSISCTHPQEGHKKEATLENRLGGVNKISFGRSGKQRRLDI
jgi:hypothetical protein